MKSGHCLYIAGKEQYNSNDNPDQAIFSIHLVNSSENAHKALLNKAINQNAV
jgi:hypothetical protein